MIPLEQQVVSLELAKELKENGYPQEGLYSFVETPTNITLHRDKTAKHLENHIKGRYGEDAIVELYVAPTEYWANIPKTKGLYQVSNVGQIRRVATQSWKGRIIKPVITNGYKRVCLSVDNKQFDVSPHRIMAQVFLPNPNDYEQVNHKNGNKLANWIENLEWCSAQQNTQHAFDNGLRKKYKRDELGKFTKEPL